MAQIRAVDRAGIGNFNFPPALAQTSAAEYLVCCARAPRRSRHLRFNSTALVSRLVSGFVVAGILLQPIRRPLRASTVFYFHHHAIGICATVGGQRFIATQAAAQFQELLASG